MPMEAPVPTPLIHNGRLYVGGGFSSEQFYCFHALTGDLIWAVDLSDDGPSTAVESEGTIIFNTESCTLFALDAKTGEQRWSWYLADPLLSSPTVASGRVFAVYPASAIAEADADSDRDESPATHVLICFDLRTGNVLWQRWIDTDCLSAPVADGNDLYVATLTGTVYRFDQTDGDVLAARRVRATSAPVIAGSRVYLTSRADDAEADDAVSEGILCQTRPLDGATNVALARPAPYLDGAIQEQSQATQQAAGFESHNGIMGGFGGGFGGGGGGSGGGFFSVESGGGAEQQGDDVMYSDTLSLVQRQSIDVIGQGNVSTIQGFQGSRILNWGDRNYCCMGDRFVCTSSEGDTLLWSYKLDGDITRIGGHLAAPPVAAGESLFLATLAGDVLQFDPRTGEVLKSYKVGAAMRFPPAIEDGRIYAGTQDGKVVCIDTGDARLTGWPMWGRDAAHSGRHAQ
jgi:Ca-activated chloride channel family protein